MDDQVTQINNLWICENVLGWARSSLNGWYKVPDSQFKHPWLRLPDFTQPGPHITALVETVCVRWECMVSVNYRPETRWSVSIICETLEDWIIIQVDRPDPVRATVEVCTQAHLHFNELEKQNGS